VKSHCSKKNIKRATVSLYFVKTYCVTGEGVVITVPGERVHITVAGEGVLITVPGEELWITVPGEEQRINVPGDELWITAIGTW